MESMMASDISDEGSLTGMDGFYKLYLINDSMVRILDEITKIN